MSEYNKQFGISSDDIITLRKNYNLSLELFSKIIGCAKKTLINYEKGTSVPIDIYLTILRSLINKPEIINDLIDSNKNKYNDNELYKIYKIY